MEKNNAIIKRRDMFFLKYYKADLERFYIMRFASEFNIVRKIRIFLFDFAIHCITVYRFRKFSMRLIKFNMIFGLLLYSIASFLSILSEFFHKVKIEKDADVGPGLFFPHASSIYIAGRIGKNCIVHQNTTIGWGYSDGKYGTATLGDNVWIGPNVVISGKIIIGSNVTISAGSVVAKDIPDNALVAGNPGRIVSTDYNNEHLFVKL